MPYFRFLLALTAFFMAFGGQAATQVTPPLKNAHIVKPQAKAAHKVKETPVATPDASGTSNPQVKIMTSEGEIVVELFPDKAPKTVENFLHYVANGFYNDTIFHRVINNFIIQGGAFTPTFEQKETLSPILNESDNGLKNEIGTLAMARGDDPNSATTQFYINLNNNLHLNFYKPESYYYGYCVFGKVIKGMDVARKIASTPTAAGGPFESDLPKEQIVIKEITTLQNQAPKTANQPTPNKDVTHG